MVEVAIVVPTLCNFRGLAELLSSLSKPTIDVTWTPIIIDNWNDNRGVAKSWNQGIDLARQAGYTHVLVSNDDIVYSPGYLDTLLRDFEFGEFDLLTGSNMRESRSSTEILDITSKGGDYVAFNPDFSSFMVRSDIFDRAGRFDENFFPAYFEDNDYHRRLNLLGMKSGRSLGAYMYHAGSVTQNFYGDGQAIVPSEEFRKNAYYYLIKWGSPPEGDNYQTPYNDPNLTAKDWKILPRA